MIRMIAFDLDKTLAELEQAVPGAVVTRLQEYENKGVAIALCSGKPAFYLSGFVRQMSLNRPVLIGENGAVVQLGIKLPPEEEYYMEADPKSIQLLEEMKREVKENYTEGIWLQPNEVELTIFFRNQDYKDRIGAYLSSKLSEEQNLGLVDRYDHVDCFDLSPGGINKGTGLRFAAGLLGIPMEKVAAVGDNTNDYPMFEEAGISVGISLMEPERAKYNVKDIFEALDLLDGMQLNLFLQMFALMFLENKRPELIRVMFIGTQVDTISCKGADSVCCPLSCVFSSVFIMREAGIPH